MTKKQKITLLSVFIAVVVVIGVIAGVLNYRATQAGKKEFQIEVISERDGYSETTDFLRTFEGCEWQESDYGIYITGFDGMQEDMDNQYWWSVNVNGESSMTGADEIPLQDGDTYSFILMQGW